MEYSGGLTDSVVFFCTLWDIIRRKYEYKYYGEILPRGPDPVPPEFDGEAGPGY